MNVKAPPIKIQGIKTKLVPLIMRSVRWDQKGRWIEPFLGSGVVAFNVSPERAMLADTNLHIINVYRLIQTGEINPKSLRAFLEEEGQKLRERGERHYYDIRERFNAEHSPFDFLFLNRSCFNGMIRFNSSGGFNVPFCKKIERFSKAYITKICNQVAWVQQKTEGKDWKFATQDWRQTLSQVETGDFVYLDPPYYGRHTDYYNQWGEEESDALAEVVKSLPSGFAYSTWKQNKYRINEHLQEHFDDFPIVTKDHFYHVGATEKLRNSVEEALVIAPGYVADSIQESMWTPQGEQLALPL